MATPEQLTRRRCRPAAEQARRVRTLDAADRGPARDQAHVGLLPLHGAFGRVSGNGTVTAAGDATGIITVNADRLTPRTGSGISICLGRLLDIAVHRTSPSPRQRHPGGRQRTDHGNPHLRDRTRPASFDANGLGRRWRGPAGRKDPSQPAGLRHDVELHRYRGDGPTPSSCTPCSPASRTALPKDRRARHAPKRAQSASTPATCAGRTA